LNGSFYSGGIELSVSCFVGNQYSIVTRAFPPVFGRIPCDVGCPNLCDGVGGSIDVCVVSGSVGGERRSCTIGSCIFIGTVVLTGIACRSRVVVSSEAGSI